MTTLAKIIIATVISLNLFSCNFDMNFGPGVKGNGKVTTEERHLNQPFNTIKTAEGLDVYLTQSEFESISVEADENLQELIITEVTDGVLHIHTKNNIGTYNSKKVLVNFKNIDAIEASSGSDVYSTNTISAEHLKLKTTSGSDMTLAVNTISLDCKSTSGSDLNISGSTNQLIADASSGSDIKAGDLTAISSQVTASSGADITINTTKKLTANASSGGDIRYKGNPETVNKSESSSGSVQKQ
ncbi:head GIN domain-containing protein [Mariniflexile sp.]|uniref:head GIN domain-containing protein n=1 Tax=Mariniflexile sp. TaxID=1979402 RepID=UPI0035656111